MLVFVLLHNKAKEGALIGSLNGDTYGITKFIGDNDKEIPYFNNVNMMCKIHPENYVEKPEKEEKENKTEEEVLSVNNEETPAENSEEGENK